MKEFDLASVDHILTTTRSVRKRLDPTRDVPRDVVEECLEIAIQAPTGSNIQNWRWVVVSDPGTRKGVADIYRRAIDPYLDIQQAAFGADPKAAKMIVSARHLGEVMHDIPVLVIPCALGSFQDFKDFLTGAGYPHPVTDNLMASGFYGSVWPAVWSFMLALRARGVGSALTQMHLALEQEMGDLLGIPKTVSQIGLIPVASFTGETFKPAARRPAKEITYWDGWKR